MKEKFILQKWASRNCAVSQLLCEFPHLCNYFHISKLKADFIRSGIKISNSPAPKHPLRYFAYRDNALRDLHYKVSTHFHGISISPQIHRLIKASFEWNIFLTPASSFYVRTSRVVTSSTSPLTEQTPGSFFSPAGGIPRRSRYVSEITALIRRFFSACQIARRWSFISKRNPPIEKVQLHRDLCKYTERIKLMLHEVTSVIETVKTII